MPYITKNNARRMLGKIDLKQVGEISGVIYKQPIFFFNKWEEKMLLLMQSFCKEPNSFLEFYRPVINIDTFHYVYESEEPSAYHLLNSCERMLSKYKNFEIPEEIKERAREKGGEEEVVKQVKLFRQWFIEHKHDYENNLSAFVRALEAHWYVRRDVKEIEKESSGVELASNYNLQELEIEIDKIIKESKKYFMASDSNKQSAIKRFQKRTFLAHRPDDIDVGDIGMSSDELKSFLREYEIKFKKPTKHLLNEYYRVKYNPELSFEGYLLERLNFKLCYNCQKTQNQIQEMGAKSINNKVETTNNDLPF